MTSHECASDEALLALYQGGQMAAFNALYQRHEGALYRYILGMIQRSQVASDLFQDVWLALIRMPPGNLKAQPFAPWLYTVARHRVIDHLRLAKNVVWAEIEEDIDARTGSVGVGQEETGDGGSQHFDLADLLHNQRMGEALMRCVMALPDLQREAFILQADSDMRLEDIAQMTESPVETVKSRLRYARNTIRQQMEGWR